MTEAAQFSAGENPVTNMTELVTEIARALVDDPDHVSVEAIQDGRIHVEKINGPFLFRDGGSPAEYGAGMQLAIERGWLEMHRSGTYVKFTFTPAGAELFA